jgi:putative nucleotidyltransferase with HDIG domain
VSTRDRIASAFSLIVLLAALGGVVALADHGSWDPIILIALFALIVGADAMEVTFKGITMSGCFLGLIVAMALLGPAQAAALGFFSTLLWAVRTRPRPRMWAALLTIANLSATPLVGGLVMEQLGMQLDVGPTDFAFAGVVVAGFCITHVLNTAMTLTGIRFVDGVPITEGLRTVIVPLLPSDLAMVLLASGIVYAEAVLGPIALAMLVALFFLYLYLYRELIVSQQRGEELTKRTQQLASLQVGVLTAMLRTLSMRDQMTARHSAAVARYARAIAQAAGCSEEEQDLAHTAGLLHDIGKFILPDHILLADSKLGEDDWQLIKMHPYQGAKVVREVEGYGPIADIIWCHHERIDGRGYPRGLAGDDIPMISRMISIADTYDVMTSRDSYRNPVSSAEAIAELRRVSGAQLDGELVEIFVRVLEQQDLAFQHTDDTDFETELAFERRVRDYAAPRAEALPAAA